MGTSQFQPGQLHPSWRMLGRAEAQDGGHQAVGSPAPLRPCGLPSCGAHLELEVVVAGGTFHGEGLGEAKEEAEGVQDAESLGPGSPSLTLVGSTEPPDLGLALEPHAPPWPRPQVHAVSRPLALDLDTHLPSENSEISSSVLA